MALTKYSERNETHAVKIDSHIIDSHIEISGASSSFEPSSVGVSP